MTWLLAYPSPEQEPKANPPELNVILDSMERTEAQDPAFSRPHEVMREFRTVDAVVSVSAERCGATSSYSDDGRNSMRNPECALAAITRFRGADWKFCCRSTGDSTQTHPYQQARLERVRLKTRAPW